jgi:hypothetical protein
MRKGSHLDRGWSVGMSEIGGAKLCGIGGGERKEAAPGGGGGGRHTEKEEAIEGVAPEEEDMDVWN